MNITAIAFGLLLLPFQGATSFLSRCQSVVHTGSGNQQVYKPYNVNDGKLSSRHLSLVRPARQTRLMGVFGLGFGEIAIVAVILGFILGPEKIMELLRSSGDTANEFKEELSKVPDEFKKGLEEGEVEVRSRKAKRIKVVSSDDDKGSQS